MHSMIFDIHTWNSQAPWHFLGVPHENSSHRKGCELGPSAVRTAISSIEEYDQRSGILINHQQVIDYGDDRNKIEPVIKTTEPGKRKALILGGDHSISILTAKALADKYPNLQILYIDAHADLRDTYKGDYLSHACVARRMYELGMQLCYLTDTNSSGFRSYSQEESSLIAELSQNSLDENEPFYVSLDLDWLDPLHMAAVGNPEPGGAPWATLWGAMDRYLKLPTCVGIDIVEYNPTLDPSGIFGVYVADLVKKIVLT